MEGPTAQPQVPTAQPPNRRPPAAPPSAWSRARPCRSTPRQASPQRPRPQISVRRQGTGGGWNVERGACMRVCSVGLAVSVGRPGQAEAAGICVRGWGGRMIAWGHACALCAHAAPHHAGRPLGSQGRGDLSAGRAGVEGGSSVERGCMHACLLSRPSRVGRPAGPSRGRGDLCAGVGRQHDCVGACTCVVRPCRSTPRRASPRRPRPQISVRRQGRGGGSIVKRGCMHAHLLSRPSRAGRSARPGQEIEKARPGRLSSVRKRSHKEI